MSVDLNALATWTYDVGVLTHVATQQSVEISIAATPELHEILSAPHWKHLGDKTDYSDDPADWVERRLYLNRANEDPPVIGVEQNIGVGDRVDYTVIELDDTAAYGPDLEDIATILQDGHVNGFAKAHSRELIKRVVHLFQIGDLL
jgi:hypothetical protein